MDLKTEIKQALLMMLLKADLISKDEYIRAVELLIRHKDLT